MVKKGSASKKSTQEKLVKNKQNRKTSKANKKSDYVADPYIGVSNKVTLKVTALGTKKKTVKKPKSKPKTKTKTKTKTTVAYTKTSLIKDGKRVYDSNCKMCHQPTGEGLVGVFPSLIGKQNKKTIKEQVLLMLNGSSARPMPSFSSLYDKEIASVLTYINLSWGNSRKVVAPQDVKSARIY